MKLRVFAVWDDAAKAFLTPFFYPTPQVAARAFREACNDPQSAFFRTPVDYTLFEIGEFDQDRGVLIPAEHNTVIAPGVLVAQKEVDK